MKFLWKIDWNYNKIKNELGNWVDLKQNKTDSIKGDLIIGQDHGNNSLKSETED